MLGGPVQWLDIKAITVMLTEEAIQGERLRWLRYLRCHSALMTNRRHDVGDDKFASPLCCRFIVFPIRLAAPPLLPQWVPCCLEYYTAALQVKHHALEITEKWPHSSCLPGR
jgi:hypothetical protein